MAKTLLIVGSSVFSVRLGGRHRNRLCNRWPSGPHLFLIPSHTRTDAGGRTTVTEAPILILGPIRRPLRPLHGQAGLVRRLWPFLALVASAPGQASRLGCTPSPACHSNAGGGLEDDWHSLIRLDCLQSLGLALAHTRVE